MAVQLFFHCVWSLEEHCFVLTVGDNVHRLSPTELKECLEEGDQKLRDFTDGDFTIKWPGGGVNLHLVKRETAKTMQDYLRKVYDGWHRFTFANHGQNKGKLHE